MKLTPIKVYLAILIITSVSACSKSGGTDSPAPGPDVLDLKEGFLSTKTGYNVGNLGDTAIVRVYTSSYQLAATAFGGTFEDKVHYWYLENAGGVMVYIRSRKHGTYLGYRAETTAPSGYHSWAKNWITLDVTPGDRNRFLVTKKGKNFYIQPADDQTLYLNTTLPAQVSYTGPQTPSSIFFLPNKQEFFFMKPF